MTEQPLLFVLLEFCTISLAVAVTTKSFVSTRFGVAFHGLFSSLVLFLYTSIFVASVSLLVSSIAVPMLLSKISNIGCGYSSRHLAITIVAVTALAPILAITGGIYSWHIHVGIQFLLAIFLLRRSGIKAGNVVALSGFGQAGSLAMMLTQTFPESVPFAIVSLEIVLPLFMMQVFKARSNQIMIHD